MNRRKLMQMAMGALPATMLSQRHLAAQQQADLPQPGREQQQRLQQMYGGGA